MSRTHLKPLIAAARPVRNALLHAEDLTDQAAIAALRCLTEIMEQRRAAVLPIATGETEIGLALSGISQAIDARSSFITLHRSLSNLRADLGLDAWYGPGETVPNEPGTSGASALRAVS